MRAPVYRLIEQAKAFIEDPEYGWISPGLLQRRMRVTRHMATYLCREVGDGTVPPQWVPLR
jgi:hypothetical protein